MIGRLCTAAALLIGAASAPAQQSGPIDPAWVYVSPLKWTHALAGIGVRSAFASVVVLYPDGEYVQVNAALIQQDKTHHVSFSVGDGTLIRAGSWSRTDDAVLRIHARDVFKDNFILNRVQCDKQGANCTTVQRPIPGPYINLTCGFSKGSAARLAGRIQCPSLVLLPLTFKLDLDELQHDASIAAKPAAAQ